MWWDSLRGRNACLALLFARRGRVDAGLRDPLVVGHPGAGIVLLTRGCRRPVANLELVDRMNLPHRAAWRTALAIAAGPVAVVVEQLAGHADGVFGWRLQVE